MRLSFSRIFLLLIASLSPVIAQSLSVGLKAGVSLREEFSGSLGVIHDESKRYTLGPMVDLRLPLHFALEFDALYRREGYTLQNFDSNFFHSYGGRERSNSWKFPIVAKYRLPGAARVEPYIGIGYAPRIVYGSQVDTYVQNDLSGNVISVSSATRDSNYDATHGLVIEGGFNLPVPHFHVSPEIRYTRWHTPFLYVVGSYGDLYFSRRNQVEVLFGLTWH